MNSSANEVVNSTDLQKFKKELKPVKVENVIARCA